MTEDYIDEERYLMFFLGKEAFGIPILKVNEIIGLMTITNIPRTPDFMKGIINLRGKIIPIIDLRIKFNMAERKYDEQNCIIIVEIPIHDQTKFIGVVVDKVAEVVNVNPSETDNPPEYGQEIDSGFLTGIAKIKDKVVMLVDINAVISCNEMVKLIANTNI